MQLQTRLLVSVGLLGATAAARADLLFGDNFEPQTHVIGCTPANGWFTTNGVITGVASFDGSQSVSSVDKEGTQSLTAVHLFPTATTPVLRASFRGKTEFGGTQYGAVNFMADGRGFRFLRFGTFSKLQKAFVQVQAQDETLPLDLTFDLPGFDGTAWSDYSFSHNRLADSGDFRLNGALVYSISNLSTYAAGNASQVVLHGNDFGLGKTSRIFAVSVKVEAVPEPVTHATIGLGVA